MDKAAQELADTEDRLASDLQVLSDVFVGPLRAWAPQVSAELPRLEPTLERLFGPLDEVCASCGEFAAELREEKNVYNAHDLAWIGFTSQRQNTVKRTSIKAHKKMNIELF